MRIGEVLPRCSTTGRTGCGIEYKKNSVADASEAVPSTRQSCSLKNDVGMAQMFPQRSKQKRYLRSGGKTDLAKRPGGQMAVSHP
jgi:hypothetical protein